MNKFPNTDSIFTVIGNEPVLDQFDVSYSALLSGSTVDNYITGSLISKKFGFSFAGIESNFVFGERGVAFSKSNTNLEDKSPGYTTPPAFFTSSPLTGYQFQPWKERAGILRNTRIFSSNERYYDSLVPNFADIVKVLGGDIFELTTLFPAGVGVVFDANTASTFPSSANSLVTRGLSESFPFEPKFSLIKRIRNVSKSFNATLDGVTGSPISPPKNLQTIVYSNVVYEDSIPAYVPIYWIDDYTSLLSSAAANTAKLVFGFGDKNGRYKISSENSGNKYIAENRNIYFYPLVGWVAKSPVIRGWKYGLKDANPHYTSCVFRRDRFGQLRDMLEQRPNSAFITDEAYSPLNYTGFNEESSALPPTIATKNKPDRVSYPIDVAFVKQDIVANKLVYTTQEPDNTWSSNLSTYATSSLPFFDDDLNGTNRDATSFGKITSGITLNVARDFFGNLSIG